MQKVLVIVGPTAIGKTGFSIEAAKRYDGEIISGDSVQVYRGFDIGSGKISKEDMQGIRHYLIDNNFNCPIGANRASGVKTSIFPPTSC